MTYINCDAINFRLTQIMVNVVSIQSKYFRDKITDVLRRKVSALFITFDKMNCFRNSNVSSLFINLDILSVLHIAWNDGSQLQKSHHASWLSDISTILDLRSLPFTVLTCFLDLDDIFHFLIVHDINIISWIFKIAFFFLHSMEICQAYKVFTDAILSLWCVVSSKLFSLLQILGFKRSFPDVFFLSDYLVSYLRFKYDNL